MAEPERRRKAIARLYFTVQASAGAAWWVAVGVSERVQSRTLGDWNPAVLVGPDLVLFVGGSALAAITGAARWGVVTAVWTTTITAALCVYALVTAEAGWGALLMLIASIATLAAATTLRLGYVPVWWFFVGPFSFRPAPRRSRLSHVLHSLAQLVFFWTTFLIALPIGIAWAEERLGLDAPWLDEGLIASTGVAVFAIGSAVGMWSCFSMAVLGEGTPLPAATGRRLVVAGPYRFVRNPMAVAGATQTVGAGLYLASCLVVLSAVAGGMIWNMFIRPEEEADLVRRFGSPYELYRQRVRCWLPVVRPERA